MGVPPLTRTTRQRSSTSLPHCVGKCVEGYIDPIRDGVIDKTLLHHCLQNPETRKELEEIVHSALEDRWHQWLSVQEAPVVVLESAILYTSGYHEFL